MTGEADKSSPRLAMESLPLSREWSSGRTWGSPVVGNFRPGVTQAMHTISLSFFPTPID